MTQFEKLLARARQNTKNVRLVDACKIAEAYGFTHRTGGKHPNLMTRPDFEDQLNFQDRNGFVPSYQVKQLLAAIDAIESA